MIATATETGEGMGRRLLAENVAVPEQLRDATGIKQLTQLLKEEFANKLGKELYSIKLACHWSHHRSPYADLLGSLTTLGDVEALSYQWQGHADKVHNADRMLKRVQLHTSLCLQYGGLATLDSNTAGVLVLWFQDALLNIRHVAVHK